MRRSKILLAAVACSCVANAPLLAEPSTDAPKTAIPDAAKRANDARADRPSESNWLMPLGGVLVGGFIAWRKLRQPLPRE